MRLGPKLVLNLRRLLLELVIYEELMLILLLLVFEHNLIFVPLPRQVFELFLEVYHYRHVLKLWRRPR